MSKGYTIPDLGDLTVVEDHDPSLPTSGNLVRVRVVVNGAHIVVSRDMLRRILPAEPKDHAAVVRAGDSVFLRILDGMVPAELAWACTGNRELFSWAQICDIDEPVRMVELRS